MASAPYRLALIAHDGKKADLISFAHKHVDVLRRFELAGTGTTGKMIEDQLGLEVHRYLSGPLGGDVQIAAAIVEGDIHAVIFFVDPLDKHPHEPDIQTLLRACNMHNVPLATNEATARYMMNHGGVRDASEDAPDDAA
ncbi:methylglyoxal synthase [Salisaeta longa]|uniref:methylglyoxal synthase n=1 Tax=Salisaeta longa TaxID=503170 RepID=UPI00040EB523|nr:methylglyoxal synthase [Salisaeta longa]